MLLMQIKKLLTKDTITDKAIENMMTVYVAFVIFNQPYYCIFLRLHMQRAVKHCMLSNGWQSTVKYHVL